MPLKGCNKNKCANLQKIKDFTELKPCLKMVLRIVFLCLIFPGLIRWYISSFYWGDTQKSYITCFKILSGLSSNNR